MDRDALSIFESLRARWLGALNISCGAFQGIMGTWVDRQLPLCHQTQVSRSLVIGHAVDPGLLLLREGTSGTSGPLAFWPLMLPVVSVFSAAHSGWEWRRRELLVGSGSILFCFSRLQSNWESNFLGTCAAGEVSSVPS